LSHATEERKVSEKSERTFKRGETRHIHCDCCERAAERIAELEAALRSIAEGYSSEADDRPQAFGMSRIARKVLPKSGQQ
jgi:hypothetical protein